MITKGTKRQIRNTMLLCVICLIISSTFVWWIDCERLANAEYKGRIYFIDKTKPFSSMVLKDGDTIIGLEPNHPFITKELIHEQEVEIIDEYSFECQIHGTVEALRYHDGFTGHKYCKRCYGEFLNKHLAIEPGLTDHDYALPLLHSNVTQGSGKARLDLDIYIPTWPDYIELKKDLVFRYDYPEPNNPLLIRSPSEVRIISKGTKIYFKEKE